MTYARALCVSCDGPMPLVWGRTFSAMEPEHLCSTTADGKPGCLPHWRRVVDELLSQRHSTQQTGGV